MKISACMIAKNEEKVIARCIESYRATVNEVIVVDTGSTDQTVAIAKSLGAKVFHFTWKDDFAAAKNYALSKAKGDWIIFLDADEYFADNTGTNVRSFLLQLDKSFNCVACKMINIDIVNGKLQNEFTHMRIFKNDKHIRYVNPIHEMLQGRNKKIQAFYADAKEILIYHTGYTSGIMQEKSERNLALLLRELSEAPLKPIYYQYIADCYFAMRDWEKVIEYTRLFMSSGAKFLSYNVRPHQNLIDAMTELKYANDDIMREINIAIEKYPYHPIFHFYKAKLLYDLNKYDLAFSECQNTLELQASYSALEFNAMATNFWTIYNVMGAVHEYRNDRGAAVENYIETLKLDKCNAACFDRLMKLIRNQPTHDIIVLINSLYDLENEADLDFLAIRLVNHALPQVLAYYTNLREKKFPKQDFVVLQMLVANKYYDKAFPTLLECYVQDGDATLATVAAAAALLSGNEQYIACCLERLPLPLTKVIKAYTGEIINFSEADKQDFLNLFHIFILWADAASLERLAALGEQFPGGVAAKVGKLFIAEGYYHIGLQFYNVALQQASGSNQSVNAALYYNQGYCLHRMNEHIAAVEAFINAYECGYRANDVYEFLRWNLDKVTNSLKERVEKLLREVTC